MFNPLRRHPAVTGLLQVSSPELQPAQLPISARFERRGD
jgi:hypothetical protein